MVRKNILRGKTFFKMNKISFFDCIYWTIKNSESKIRRRSLIKLKIVITKCFAPI